MTAPRPSSVISWYRSARRGLRRRSANLWVVPAFTTAFGIMLARFLVWIDHRIPQDAHAWYLFAGQPASARELLSTIAASLMTFTSIVFSVTILVLQLASQQFSPRVLRTFLEDRFTRAALGVFIASFVYAMVLLPEVRDEMTGHAPFVPALAVSTSLGLVLLCSGVFVQYIHHIAHSIRAVHIVQRVADDALRAVDRVCFPAGAGLSAEVVEGREATCAHVISNPGRAGVVGSIDEEYLLKVAVDRDLVIQVLLRMGDFVPHGAPLLRVTGGDAAEREGLVAHVHISAERTLDEDPGFGLRQLVDIATRALSPGVNDPTTAVQALDRIHDVLREMAPRTLRGSQRVDSSGRVRLVIARLDWSGYVQLAFDEIRQYGRESLHVATRLHAILDDLISIAATGREGVLREQKRLLREACRGSFDVPLEIANSAHNQEA